MENEDLIAILYREELKEKPTPGPGSLCADTDSGTFPRLLQAHLTEGIHYRALEADWVPNQELLRICGQDYVSFTREYYRAANSRNRVFQRILTPLSSGLVVAAWLTGGKVEEAARLVIGQVKKACDIVQAGEFEKAVCIGGGLHHAKPNWGEGVPSL